VGQVALARGRELACDPAVGGVDVGLVDGAPQAHKVAELISDATHVGQECASRFAVCPSTLAREPQRACEVMQRDHRLDPLLSQLTEYVAVVPDLPRIELALRGF